MAKRDKRNKRNKARGAAPVGGGATAAGDGDSAGTVGPAGAALHFTVGSLPETGGRTAGFFDFARELDLVKAALLYADRVRLCSVGASFVSGLDDLGRMPLDGKLAAVRRFLPMVEPGATPAQLENAYELMEAVRGGRGAGRGHHGPRDAFAGRRVLERGWAAIKNLVQEQYRDVGAEGFREALRSGLVELHPFEHINEERILDMGVAAARGTPRDEDAAMSPDAVFGEYRARILEAVGNGGTYPLFDDLTGDIVGEAVREGLILPSQGAVARSRHGGLSGDLLRRLPLFERATVPEVLDIREELSEHLDAFREAVAGFAGTIAPASWDEDFAEEAERVFWERVAPAVGRIERAVEENRDLRQLSFRFGPPMAVGGASSLGAFVGGGSVIASLAILAAGVAAGAYQGAAAVRDRRRAVEGNQLYFYYRAGTLLGGTEGGR